jgi:hypothetical protein
MNKTKTVKRRDMRKYFIIISALLVLSGCEYSISHKCKDPSMFVAGLQICTSGMDIDPQEIERTVEAVEIVSKQIYGIAIDKPFAEELERIGTTVTFLPNKYLAEGCEKIAADVFLCPSLLGGVNIQVHKPVRGDTMDIFVNYFGCIAWGGLPHELLHAVEYFYLGGGTEDHSTPGMFEYFARENKTPVADTAEYKVKSALINEFCK